MSADDQGPPLILEQKIVELEAALKEARRCREAAEKGPGSLLRVLMDDTATVRVEREAEIALGLARAELDARRRAAAEAAQLRTVEANEQMARASEAAALASADAASASKWAAFGTLAAAIVAAAGVALQAWQAWGQKHPAAPVAPPVAPPAASAAPAPHPPGAP